MNIKEYIKLSFNDELYGSNWKNPNWMKAYMSSFQKYKTQVKGIKGGGYDNSAEIEESASAAKPNTNLESELGFTIRDTFLNYNTKSMLFGRRITPYYAKIIVEVAKYYDSQDISGNTELKQSIIKYLHKVMKENPNINLTKLMAVFNSQTIECLLAYLLIAFQTNKLDLILRTTYTFGRVLPLKCKTEWFDNYRLNAYGNVLNMIMYKPDDRSGIYTIDEEAKPINKSQSLGFYPKIIKFLVGSLRAFIILNNLLPDQVGSNGLGGGKLERQTSTDDHTLNESEFSILLDQANSDDNQTDKSELPDFITNDSLSSYDVSGSNDFYSTDYSETFESHVMELLKGSNNSMSDEEVCDICYQHFPFFFGGAHGCDVFEISSMSLSVDEITQFLNRYPSARVGYILNTATYKSGKGQHWVALELTKGKAKLVCSQRSDFDVFEDGGSLVNALKRNGYGMEHNERSIQRDDYACGTYAFISLMELLRFGDIKKAVDNIGVNMEHLGSEIGKASSADKVRENLVGWLSGGNKK